jgi:tetratricopeptide (TPR) repeat protein
MSDPGSKPPAASAAEYARAIALFQAGRLPEAERVLRDLAAAAPSLVEALQLLGTTLSSQGRPEEGLEWFDRARALRAPNLALLHNRAQALFALGRFAEARAEAGAATALEPASHAAWNLLANVLAATGELDGAERAYRKALALNSAHAETHYNLALLLQEAGRHDEALACYRKAIALRPAFAPAHNNLANVLRAKGRAEDAMTHYAEAVRLDPQLADAVSNYGTALREAGRAQEALGYLERAAQLKPQSAEVHHNRGVAYFEAHRFAAAAACERQALALQPSFVEARNNLGNVLAALGAEDEAVALYREAIAQAPDHPDAHSNLGIILQERGEIEAAMACYDRALALRPDHADAINNVGYLLQEQGRRREAMELYRKALEANPESARAGYNLALSHLSEHEFEPGWKLHELRYHTKPPIAVRRAFTVPMFSAADWGRGGRLAVWREQGVGDQLLYSTLVPDLAARGEDFVLEADARLVAAFTRAHPQWKVTAPGDSNAAFATCDRHIPVASLPMLLRPTLASFASQPAALLAADAGRAAAFRERLATRGARPVGISWRSFQPRTRGYVQQKKSAPLEAFMGLSQRSDLRLLDLQYGDTAAERDAFAARGGRLSRLDGLDLFNDLDGVLAAIEGCDLVVTTSNVTAHLAGALGKETLLVYLSANPPFHYWVPDESGRCLWYPSVRIVTGRDLDSWPKAFARIDAILSR